MIAKSRAQRLALIAATLEVPGVVHSDSELAAALPPPDASSVYLVLSVLRSRIPEPDEVIAALRTWRTDGPAAVLALAGGSTGRPGVRVSAALVVDVHDTSHQQFTTGIQRVVRSTLAHWPAPGELDLVAWTPDFTAPRTLSASEHATALGHAARKASPPSRTEVVVPFGGALAVLEIATDRRRATRLRTIAEFSGSRSVAVGHDCIPITSAETTGAGMPGAFSRYLSALAEFDVVATTSSSSHTEFGGWRQMLSGSGVTGPEVIEVGLPSVAPAVEAADPATPDPATPDPATPDPDTAAQRVRQQLGIGDGAVVLAVGSHEPRKNHLALLHAAESVWREGGRFTLVMVGGNSWNAAGFHRIVDERRADGRPIVTVSGASDATIEVLYELARFTVFPSLNEGFGLPIVESIARGTPVITSDYGSMRDLADGYGGVLVDPHDDAALAAAISDLLSDDARLHDLREQTRLLPQRDWSDYAADLRRLVYPANARTARGEVVT